MSDREFFERKCNEAAARMRALLESRGVRDLDAPRPIRLGDLTVPMGVKGLAALLIDGAEDAARFYRGAVEFNCERAPARNHPKYDAEADARSSLEFGLRNAFEDLLRMWERASRSEGAPYFKAKPPTEVLHFVAGLEPLA